MYNPMEARIDDVISCEGKLYLVTKLNPKKVKATDLKTGKTWNIPYYMANFVRKATNADRSIEIELSNTALVLGEVVQFKTELYVVIGMTNSGAKIVKLGGDHDKYYRNVSPSVLTKVELSAILS